MQDATPSSLSRALLGSLDAAWDTLWARLEGLTADEYWWRPVPGCWTIREVDGVWSADWADPDPVPAPVTTIGWRLWHLAVDCFDGYSAGALGVTGTGLSGRSWVADPDTALGLLDQSWLVFREGVAGWDEEHLWRTLGPRWGASAGRSHVDLVLHAHREMIHHGAEIALLRDLYRAARGGGLGS